MMLPTSYIVALCILFSSSLATYHPQALRDLKRIKIEPGLIARQTNVAECTASAASLVTSVPSVTGELSSFIASIAATTDLSDPTDLCNAADIIPSSLLSEYSSYESAISSWYGDESSNIAALITSCSNEALVSTISSVISQLSMLRANGCPTATEDISVARTTGASGTEGTGGSMMTTTSVVPVTTAGGIKYEGMVAGAVAAAALLGAAAIVI